MLDSLGSSSSSLPQEELPLLWRARRELEGAGWSEGGADRQADGGTRRERAGEEVTAQRLLGGGVGWGRRRRRRQGASRLCEETAAKGATPHSGQKRARRRATLAAAPWHSRKLTALTRTWPARGCTRGTVFLDGGLTMKGSSSPVSSP